MELRAAALDALCIADPAAKAAAARALLEHGGNPDSAAVLQADAAALPGRPARPLLVPVQQVPRRSPHTAEGRAALLHAVAHIEFNAVKMVFLVEG